MYLIYLTEQDAWDRSETEGIERGLSYHKTGKGTRFVTSPKLTNEDTYALDVEGYELTEDEANTVVDSYEPKTFGDEI